jgi:hypothetical protein
MSYVFLSYLSADREIAHQVRDSLISRGIEVWWDRDRRPDKGRYEHDLKHRLEECSAVLAVLTPRINEFDHRFVNLEMEEGYKNNKLIALLIGDFNAPLNIESMIRMINRRGYPDIGVALCATNLDDLVVACSSGGAEDRAAASAYRAEVSSSLEFADSRQCALACAVAFLEQCAADQVMAWARELKELIDADCGVPETSAGLVLRSRTAELAAIQAEQYDVLEDRFSLAVPCVRFQDGMRANAVADHVWYELDAVRPALTRWLEKVITQGSLNARFSACLTLGTLSRSRFATLHETILWRWIMGEDVTLRSAADLVYRVASDQPEIARFVTTACDEWARSDRIEHTRAALHLACGYTGSRHKELTINVLKTVAGRKTTDFNILLALDEAIDRLARANRDAEDNSLFDHEGLLVGLCEWVSQLRTGDKSLRLPLALVIGLVARLPLMGRPGKFTAVSIASISTNPQLLEALAQLFNLTLQQTGELKGLRDEARACLIDMAKRYKARAPSHDGPDPVLPLIRAIYALCPTDNDINRLIFAMTPFYTRDQITQNPPATAPGITSQTLGDVS